jgi:hypothetical protein
MISYLEIFLQRCLNLIKPWPITPAVCIWKLVAPCVSLVIFRINTENSFILLFSVLVRTALLAIIGFMPTHGNGAIGSLDYSADERKVLAKKYDL